MKLLAMVVAGLVSLGGIAAADEYQPPQQQQRPQLRRLLLERFDRNGDGKLGPRERRQAVRALKKLERKLARGGGGQNGGRNPGIRMRKLIQRYDTNHDGDVGPGEMPPNLARKLRRFDRDGNGWLDEGDFGRNHDGADRRNGDRRDDGYDSRDDGGDGDGAR